MQSMVVFSTWYLSMIPQFLMSEPIRYFTGLVVTISIFGLIVRIFHSK